MKTVKSPPMPKIVVVDSEEKAKADVKKLKKGVLYGLDSETADPNSPFREWPAHKNCKKNQIIIWSYYDHNRKKCVVVHGNLLKFYAKFLHDPAYKKVGTNLQFDLNVFEENGFPVHEKGIVGDTVTESFMQNENRLQHGLKPVTEDVFGIKMTKFTDLFGYAKLKKNGEPYASGKIEVEDVWKVWAGKSDLVKTSRKRFYEYAAEDPFRSAMLHLYFKRQLKKEKTWDFYRKWELPMTWCIMRMEVRGFAMDTDFLEDVYCELETQHKRVSFVIRGLLDDPLFNPGSSKQKQDTLLGELNWPVVKVNKDSGNPSLDAEALQTYVSMGYDLAGLFLEYNNKATMKNTFVGGLLNKIDTTVKAPVCYTRFNQTRAKTGRLSSGSQKEGLANLMNVPARKEKDPFGIRRAFVARPGMKLIVLDLSGIELCGIAEISGDKVMTRALQQGENLHALTACSLFGLSYPKIALRKDGRVGPEYDEWLEKFKEDHDTAYVAGKLTNFSLNYGMSAYTYAKRLGVTEKEAERRIKAYFARYKGVERYMRDAVERCRRDGYVSTLSRRRRRLPGIYSYDKGIREHNERAAINAPIQGYNADIIKIIQVTLDHMQLNGEIQAVQLLQVYDEIVFEVAEDQAEEECRKIKKVMMSVPVKVLGLKIPLGVSGGVGDNWLEAK